MGVIFHKGKKYGGTGVKVQSDASATSLNPLDVPNGQTMTSYLNSNFIAGSPLSTGDGWSLWGIGNIRILNLVAFTKPIGGVNIIPAGSEPNSRLTQACGVGVSGSGKYLVSIVVTGNYVYCFNPTTGAQIAFTDVRGSVMWGVD